jgi:hypothetical protein
MPMVVLWSDVGARYTTLILMLTCTMYFGCCQFKFSFQRSTWEHASGYRKGDSQGRTLSGTPRF